MSPREQVLQQALALSPADQAFVAFSLEEHLAAHVSSEIEEASGLANTDFLNELRRRSQAYRTGKSAARDAAVVLQEQRQRQARETAP